MPIPKPNSDESRDKFMGRCMSDSEMIAEYSDENQRAAVCGTAFNDKDETPDSEKHIRQVTETEDSYVIEFGKDMTEEDDEKDFEDIDFEGAENEYMEFPSNVKASDEEESQEYGYFEGYGSVFDNTDLGNDVIKKGAFKKSVRKRGLKGIKLLYQHKTDMPIGVFDSIKEDDHGLYVKGRLALKTTAGRDAYELLKMGALDGLSIGFRATPKGYSYDKRKKTRVLEEVDLMEVSLVTFPMNPQAKIQSVKGQEITIREWENGMRDAFSLSRSEAKLAAKAVHESFIQRDAVEDNTELVDAIKTLTSTLKAI